MDFIEATLQAVREYAGAHGLPPPSRRELGSGLSGVVYETPDPGTAVKVSPSMTGYEIIERQGHPGVVRVFHASEIPVDSAPLREYGFGFDGPIVNLLVMWIERLPFVGSEIWKPLGIPPRAAARIEQALESVNGRSSKSMKRGLPILRRYHAFKALDQLLSEQAWSDMSLHNVGLSTTGWVVAFDW